MSIHEFFLRLKMTRRNLESYGKSLDYKKKCWLATNTLICFPRNQYMSLNLPLTFFFSRIGEQNEDASWSVRWELEGKISIKIILCSSNFLTLITAISFMTVKTRLNNKKHNVLMANKFSSFCIASTSLFVSNTTGQCTIKNTHGCILNREKHARAGNWQLSSKR